MPRKKFANGLPKPPKGTAWHYNPQTKVWRAISLKLLPPHHGLVTDATLMMQGIDNLKYPEEKTAVAPATEEVARNNNNNFDPDKIYQHVVRHGDTFPGICLRYGITPTQLRQANNFGGSNLQLAPSVLTIPVDPDSVEERPCDETEWITPRETLMSAVMNALDNNEYGGTMRLSPLEAKCYLEMHDWDVDKAIAEAREDAKFEAECLNENHHEFEPAEQVQ